MDYSGTCDSIENIGGNDVDDDIDACDVDYFQPTTSKHSYLYLEDVEQTGRDIWSLQVLPW